MLKTNFSNIAYTDYPMLPLGDEKFESAPIRKVFVLMYDGDKYAKVFVPQEKHKGFIFDCKACYLYKEAEIVNCFDAKPFTVDMETWLSLDAYEG